MRYFYYLATIVICFCALFSHNLIAEENNFPVEFVNQSQIAGDEDVYITIKGTDIQTGDSCFIAIDGNGKGTCQKVDATTDSTTFTYPLSTLKRDTSQALIQLPYLASGRIYISIGQPVRFQIEKQGKKKFIIVDPDGFKPRDPNYYTLYDKIEFSYVPPNKEGFGGGVWMNPTAVDFFSIPLRIEQEGSEVFKKTGFSIPRMEIFDAISMRFMDQDKTSTQEWSKLFLTYLQDEAQTVLRLMAPGKAMIQGVPGTNPMNEKLLSDQEKFGLNFTDFLWDYYSTKTLGIDTGELQGAGVKLNDYLFTGKVDKDSQRLIFTNASDPSLRVSFAKPKRSVPWFAGAVDEFDASNNTPKAIIVRQLTSAFDVGLLPAEDAAILDRAYFDRAREEGKYYNENPLLPKDSPTGPWFDLYSAALHMFGADQPIYTFAYDDALGQDGTLHDPNPLEMSQATITIGDMSGTVIPRPFEDTKTYSVTVLIGKDSRVLYQGDTLASGAALRDVSVPMEVELNGQAASIYFSPAIVLSKSSQADGIVIEKQDETSVRLIFPGK